MGMLKTFLSQSPEKHEQKGDAFFKNAVWGMAKIEYEKALAALERASSGHNKGWARVQEKLRKAKEALATEHRQTGQNLMEIGDYDEARDLFELAIALTQDKELILAIQAHLLEIKRLTSGDIQRHMSESGLFAPSSGEVNSPEPEDETFMALLGTLPEEVQGAYISYGSSFRSGYLALNRGEFNVAADELSRAMSENPAPDSFISLELATAYLNLGKLDEARRLLESFLRYHPDALPGYQVLCEVFWEMRAFDQAEALLDSCPDEFKNSLAYHLLRGETLSRGGNISEAISFYQDFMKECGWNEAVVRALAGTYEISGDLEKARALYADIISQCSSCHTRVDPFIKRKYADISFDLGRRSFKILEAYLSLIREDPNNSPFYYERVRRLDASLGNKEAARRYQGFTRPK